MLLFCVTSHHSTFGLCKLFHVDAVHFLEWQGRANCSCQPHAIFSMYVNSQRSTWQWWRLLSSLIFVRVMSYASHQHSNQCGYEIFEVVRRIQLLLHQYRSWRFVCRIRLGWNPWNRDGYVFWIHPWQELSQKKALTWGYLCGRLKIRLFNIEQTPLWSQWRRMRKLSVPLSMMAR